MYRVGKNNWYMQDHFSSNWLKLNHAGMVKLEQYYNEWMEDHNAVVISIGDRV